MLILLTTVHVIVCLFLIMVVLLQQGKGADLSVFGGGSTQAAFGARGAATLLHKLTVAGFIAFILTTTGIGLLRGGSSADSVMRGVDTAVEESAPADEAAAPEGEAPATPEAVDPSAEDAEMAPADETPAGDTGDGG